MATIIRLSKRGSKKKIQYRLVVQDDRVKTTGTVIENLGFYNPLINPPEIKFDRERVDWWLGKGVRISPAAKKLITSK